MISTNIAARISKDKEVFWEIIDEFEEKLLRYILRITDIDYEEAENLLQEVFIKVYKNIYDYDESYSFSSWIYRIAHNIVIDHHRKNEKRSHNISLEDEDYDNLIKSITDNNNPHLDLTNKDLKICVQKAIRELPRDYREAIVLKFMEDRSYDEISDILKIPIWTVWTLINRAKIKLKDLFEKHKCI